jgi:hypothetical protein
MIPNVNKTVVDFCSNLKLPDRVEDFDLAQGFDPEGNKHGPYFISPDQYTKEEQPVTVYYNTDKGQGIRITIEEWKDEHDPNQD